MISPLSTQLLNAQKELASFSPVLSGLEKRINEITLNYQSDSMRRPIVLNNNIQMECPTPAQGSKVVEPRVVEDLNGNSGRVHPGRVKSTASE